MVSCRDMLTNRTDRIGTSTRGTSARCSGICMEDLSLKIVRSPYMDLRGLGTASQVSWECHKVHVLLHVYA